MQHTSLHMEVAEVMFAELAYQADHGLDVLHDAAELL